MSRKLYMLVVLLCLLALIFVMLGLDPGLDNLIGHRQGRLVGNSDICRQKPLVDSPLIEIDS